MTINIIKKWENLTENFFDENLEHTEEPSKQISVIEAIEKSSDILPDKIENLSSTLRAMDQITIKFFNSNPSDYQPYHKIQKQIATRVMDSYFYTEVRDALESLVQEKVDKELEQQNSQLLGNIELLEENFRSLNEGLLYKITEIISNNDRAQSKGFLYEIINEKNTTSYLIGTIHFEGGENFLKNTSIKEQVIKCSEFISEIGDLGLDFKAVNIMDDILTRLANSHKLTIHALETLKDRQEARDSNMPKFLTYEELEKKGQLKRYEEYNSNKYLLKLDQIDAWEKGDLEHLKRIQKIITKLTGTKEVLKKRNMNWLTGKRINVLDKIKQTENPISIVVGASHLFGKTGLLKAFEDHGLKIQQI